MKRILLFITCLVLLFSLCIPSFALTSDDLLESYYYTTTLGGNVTNRGTSFSLSNKPHGLNYVYNFKDYRSDGKTILVQQFDVSNSGGLASNIGIFRPTAVTSVDILGNTITHNALSGTSGAVSSYDDSNGRFSVMWEQLGENTETYNSFRMTMVFEHGYNFHDYMNFALLLNWYAPVQTVVVYTSDPVIVSVSEQATMTDIKAAIDQASKDVQDSIDKKGEEIKKSIDNIGSPEWFDDKSQPQIDKGNSSVNSVIDSTPEPENPVGLLEFFSNVFQCVTTNEKQTSITFPECNLPVDGKSYHLWDETTIDFSVWLENTYVKMLLGVVNFLWVYLCCVATFRMLNMARALLSPYPSTDITALERID